MVLYLKQSATVLAGLYPCDTLDLVLLDAVFQSVAGESRKTHGLLLDLRHPLAFTYRHPYLEGVLGR